MIGCSSPVTSGRLEVMGLDVRAHPRRIKRRLGVVAQENNLDEELTVRENLRVYARFFGLGGETARRRRDELIEFVQLTEKADVNVRFLSGGMRRRLMIARALVSEPQIMILDEPSTGLDPQARHVVWEKLRRLKREDRTLLLTTHYMDEAEQLCDRLVVMEGGRIVAEGRPRDLIREHVARDVVEISSSPAENRRVLERFADSVSGHEMLEDRLRLFSDDGEGLLHQLTGNETGLAGAEFQYRRATLEDVFLKLTGRTLNE
jgi:lipooligosaccharide transport system ATP-binding protein